MTSVDTRCLDPPDMHLYLRTRPSDGRLPCAVNHRYTPVRHHPPLMHRPSPCACALTLLSAIANASSGSPTQTRVWDQLREECSKPRDLTGARLACGATMAAQSQAIAYDRRRADRLAMCDVAAVDAARLPHALVAARPRVAGPTLVPSIVPFLSTWLGMMVWHSPPCRRPAARNELDRRQSPCPLVTTPAPSTPHVPPRPVALLLPCIMARAVMASL